MGQREPLYSVGKRESYSNYYVNQYEFLRKLNRGPLYRYIMHEILQKKDSMSTNHKDSCVSLKYYSP